MRRIERTAGLGRRGNEIQQMHGIVHRTLKEFVIERAGEDAWETVADRAELEPTLYLPVSRYDDREVDAVLETLSTLAGEDRRRIERGFGRALAPEFLSTFDAYLGNEWGLSELLTNLESLTDELAEGVDDVTIPDVAGQQTDETAITVTYRTPRDQRYCWVAYGVLEGLVDAFDADATVTKTDCGSDDDTEACRFVVELET